jgi:hypothetical protein
VLALQAEHMNFLPLEIESNELNVGGSSEEGSVSEASNTVPYTGIPLNNVFAMDGALNGVVGEGSSSSNHLGEANGLPLNVTEEGNSSNRRIQLGMVSLPDNLYVDPRMLCLENPSVLSKTNPEAVRLWAKFFAPPCSEKGIDIPTRWFDFFTLNLLHPDRFTWAKSLLESPS